MALENRQKPRTVPFMHPSLRFWLAASLCLTTGCVMDSQPKPARNLLPPELEQQCTPALRITAPAGMQAEFGRSSLSVPPQVLSTPPDTGAPVSVSLTPPAQRLADVLGLNPLLSRAAQSQDKAGRQAIEADLQYLAVGQDISDRVLHVMIEVSEIVAELDCERARSLELAVRLEEIENDIRNKRTVTAVMAEPTFHILAATSLVFGMPVVAGGLEVVGNGLRLGFGLAAGRVEQNETMTHVHNFMQEVWEGPQEPSYFPPTVWHYLNQPAKNGNGTTSREVILEIWRGHLGEPGSEMESHRMELFFGNGGIYGVRDLRHRADMLGVLSAFIALMIHDIKALFTETLASPADPKPPPDGS
jgi:hypothetical protein